MTKYSPALEDKICAKIAEGNSVLAVSKMDGFPSNSTIHLWLNTKPGFSDKYARAKEQHADLLFDDCLVIADEEQSDVQRAKLRIDTRKWMAGKIAPKKYGDKVINEHSGPDGKAMQFEDISARATAFKSRLVGTASRSGTPEAD